MREQCPNPRCGSYKIQKTRRQYITVGLFFTIFSIPWVFILIGIPFLVAGIVITLWGLFIPGDQRKCKSCHMKYMREKNGAFGVIGD